MPKTLDNPRSSRHAKRSEERPALHRLIENDLIRRVSYGEYRDKVRRAYSGPKGALLSLASMLSLHIPMGERVFRRRKFDLQGVKSVLDIGSGAGQLAGHVLKYGEADVQVTCMDLSAKMLERARIRLHSPRPRFVAADLAQLPFADGSFDCITCGYVLEHLPNAEPGLAEMARVLERGGRMFLLCTEDTFSGAWTSRLWLCRTHNRADLRKMCEQHGLEWRQEIWFTRLHKTFRAGGICVEIVKR